MFKKIISVLFIAFVAAVPAYPAASDLTLEWKEKTSHALTYPYQVEADYTDNGDGTITLSSVGMTYPGAGIPLSTGSAWGTSITNNSANWNTAYGWGNHSGLYLPIGGGTLTGDLALTTHNITLTGSLGATGARLTKGWFTDLEVTNAIAGSITGNAGGSSASCTGNSATATKSTNLIGGNSTTLLGSIPYQSDTDTTTLLSPNVTTTKKFLTQTGDATNGAAPAWGTLQSGDIPDLSGTYLAVGAKAADSDLLDSHDTSYFQTAIDQTTDLIVKSLTVGKNGSGGTAGIITLRDGANPGTTATLSYTKWADLEAANGIVKCNGSGDYSAATAGTDYMVKGTATPGQYWSGKATDTVAGATWTSDWASGNVHYIVLGNGAHTEPTLSNPQDGARYMLILKQPASGAAGTVTWPATMLWSGGTAPTLTATNGKVDIITLIYESTNSKYYCGSTLNY
ncbi:MAG: hypothetical protein WCI77_08100 [Candidatus Omnitrophota bacterium]